jgi:hypothetical protein
LPPSALFGITLVGTLFWAASPEAATVLFASQNHWHPLVIGLLATAGQTVALAGLFAFGDQLRRRWRWFDRKCERVRTRVGDRMARNAVVVAATSGLLGFPPVSVTATLAPGLAPRPVQLLPVMVVLRIVRFTAVAALAVHSGLKWPW